MDIKLRNFRGASIADIEHKSITLIAGKNHQGKTSICQGIAATLIGGCPIKGLLKGQYKMLVREGAPEANIHITRGNGGASMSYPSAEYTSSGRFQNISPFAAGIDSLSNYSNRKDRADKISKFIDIDPSDEDLINELKSLDFEDLIIDATLASIKMSGYSSTYSKTTEKATQRKGAWREVTGETYGKKKARDWFPDNYFIGLDNKSLEDLKQAVVVAKEDRDAAIAMNAINDAELTNLKELASRHEMLTNQLIDCKVAVESAKKKQDRSNQDFETISNKYEIEAETPCPHCGGMVNIDKGTLKIAKIVDEAEREQAKKDLALIAENINTYTKEAQDAQDLWLNAFKACEESEKAKKELEKTEENKTSAKHEGSMEVAESNLQKATDNLDAYDRKNRAITLHQQITQDLKLADILGPDGIRKTKLVKTVRDLNNRLETLTISAKWGMVKLTPEFTITYNDRPLTLCSKSEAFKAELIVRVLIGELDGSGLILVDDADVICGKDGRNGLFSMLMKAKVESIVFMAMPDKDKLPPLGKIGGSVYWVEKGVLTNETK